jgi:hypothetical protein
MRNSLVGAMRAFLRLLVHTINRCFGFTRGNGDAAKMSSPGAARVCRRKRLDGKSKPLIWQLVDVVGLRLKQRATVPRLSRTRERNRLVATSASISRRTLSEASSFPNESSRCVPSVERAWSMRHKKSRTIQRLFRGRSSFAGNGLVTAWPSAASASCAVAEREPAQYREALLWNERLRCEVALNTWSRVQVCLKVCFCLRHYVDPRNASKSGGVFRNASKASSSSFAGTLRAVANPRNRRKTLRTPTLGRAIPAGPTTSVAL